MNDAPPRRIWLCADDYGLAEGVNRAIRDLISRGRLNATSVMMVGAAAMFVFVGIALLSVLHLQRVAGHDPLGAGVRLMPMMLSYVVLSAFGARIVRTVGFTVTLTIGGV